MTFSPKTVAMMRALFGKHTCSKCGERAERFLHKMFLCHNCAPGRYSKRSGPVEVSRGREVR